jgi:adenine phosphoribosyltransferase
MDYSKYIGVTPDFPKKGISFKDISPLLRDGPAFHSAIKDLAKLAADFHPDILCGPESRAFIFGAALAYEMNIGFVMARKAGKLPGVVYQISYQLEYGNATLAIPKDSFKNGARVLLVDDLMATGGTFAALKQLVTMADGTPVGALTFITLEGLNGAKNSGMKCASLITLSDKS